MNKIYAPQSNANDDIVFISEWKFENNEFVKKGDHIVSVESAKVVEEIYSEQDGYLERLFDTHEKIKVGEPIAILNNEKKNLSNKTLKKVKENTTFTKKAEKILIDYGIDKNKFKLNNIVKEKDVLLYIKENKIQKKNETSHLISDQLIILNKNSKPYHAAVYISNLGVIDLSLLGSKITNLEVYNFDNCKCNFFEIKILNKKKAENFFKEPFLLTDKIIKKERSSKGWSLTAESADYILNFRKTRSKNLSDMNCIEWLVYGLELGGIKIPENVLTASTLYNWAKNNLKILEKKNNLNFFNKYY